MAFCSSCGGALATGAVFCPACGSSNSGAPAASAMPAPAAGLNVNGASALAYLAGLITGIIFLVIEPYRTDRTVRFHAWQSIFFNLAWIGFWILWTIAGLVLGAVTKGLFLLISAPVSILISLGGLCLWLYLMYSAYNGKRLRLPVLGALAEKQAGR